MRERKRSLTFFLMALFIIGSLPITNSVSAEDEVDNWPENDAWLHIELISWSANETVEWDNNGGLPDPIFKICIEADGDNLDCINTPTWDNQMTLNNSWNYSIDIPDHTNILNITIECEDNDALNDDECDMNSELDEWKLYAEYNWSATPTLTVTGNGDGDGNDTWKNAASTWKFTIDGFGDEDGDGVSDNVDQCPSSEQGLELLNQTEYIGCTWNQLDIDSDGAINKVDSFPTISTYSNFPVRSASIYDIVSSEGIEMNLTLPFLDAGYGVGGTIYDIDNSIKILGTNDFYFCYENIEHECHGEEIWASTPRVSEMTKPSFVIDIDGDMDQDIIQGKYIYINEQNLVNPSDSLIIYPQGFLITEISPDCLGSGRFTIPIDSNLDGVIELFSPGSISSANGELEGYAEICDFIYDPINNDYSFDKISSNLNLSCEYHNPLLHFERSTETYLLLCENNPGQSGSQIYWIKNHELISSSFFPHAVETGEGRGIGGLGDFNGDGTLDFIDQACKIHFSSGTSFLENFSLSFAEGWLCKDIIQVIDIEGDGDLDISTPGYIIENTGDYFVAHNHIDATVQSTIFHQILDFDNDGDLDKMVMESVSGGNPVMRLLYNPSIPDMDGDGVKDNDDICSNTELGLTVDSRGCSASQLDSDFDGVTDDVDLCPQTPIIWLPVSESGCSLEQLDNDNDGVNNLNDNCPNTPEGDLVNIRGCSIDDDSFPENPESDTDNDGVIDSNDACPNTTANVAVDSIGCSIDDDSFPENPDTDSDGDGVYGSLDECANTPFGATVDFTGCPMDSDFDGVYDGIDECPSSNNPSPSDMDKSSEVDSTGCFIDSAGSETNSGSVAFGFLGVILVIGLIFLLVRSPILSQPSTVPVLQQTVSIPQVSSVPIPHVSSVPTPQVSSRERQLEHQSRQAQIEAQRLRQELAKQAQFTQQLQNEAAQKQMSDAALAQKQHELAVAQQEKAELEAKLAEAEKKAPVIQNFYVQDSVISGDLASTKNINQIQSDKPSFKDRNTGIEVSGISEEAAEMALFRSMQDNSEDTD